MTTRPTSTRSTPDGNGFDAILIPGGGLLAGGQLPVWVQRRLERAAELQGSTRYLIALSAGTPHKAPVLDPQGFPIFESAAAANFWLGLGIAPQKVRIETSSYDTIGNAYFSRVIHVDPLGLRRLLVITSQFHLPRTESAFRWVYSLDAPAQGYELTFEAVEDAGLEQDALALRQAREQKSLEQLLETSKTVRTLPQFTDWLFTYHEAYAVGAAVRRAEGDVLNTY